VWLKLHVPSRQWAVASGGFDPFVVLAGWCTDWPSDRLT
jgi:hypothetical protein